MAQKEKGTFFGLVKVGAKGQIVVPAEARKLYGITEGDSLLVLGNKEGMAIVRPELTNDVLNKLINKESDK